MPPFEAAPSSNQIPFDFMSDSGVAAPRGPASAGPQGPFAEGTLSHLPVLSAVFALGVVAVAVGVSTAGTPILLTALSSFAILGVFFVLGAARGTCPDRRARADNRCCAQYRGRHRPRADGGAGATASCCSSIGSSRSSSDGYHRGMSRRSIWHSAPIWPCAKHSSV